MNYNLNKKLIEELGEGRIAIDNTGNLKLDLLKAIMKEAFPTYKLFNCLGGIDTYYFKTTGILHIWESSIKTDLPTVSLLDFIKKEWQLPEKWCVKGNFKEVRDWFSKNNQYNKYVNYEITYGNCYFHYPKYTNNYVTSHHHYMVQNEYTEITFEQFQKYVLNNTKMENKEEIVGWKIDKKDYLHAANCISTLENIKEDTILTESEWPRSLKKLREAGVLDLWFKEVYTTKEKVLTLSNGKQVKIRKGEILAILDSIGSKIELNSLTALLRPFFSQLKNWPVELTDAKYKIGCWENVTLADIKLIIKEYEELNK
jgi:hypothetical protein